MFLTIGLSRKHLQSVNWKFVFHVSKHGSGGSASSRASAACSGNPNSIPLGAGLFSLAINQWCVLNQIPLGGATLTDFPSKNWLWSLRRSKFNKHRMSKKCVQTIYSSTWQLVDKTYGFIWLTMSCSTLEMEARWEIENIAPYILVRFGFKAKYDNLLIPKNWF